MPPHKEIFIFSFLTFISNLHLGLSTTKDLLSKSVLRYSAWMMAFITCLGNSLVLWGRYTQRDENRALSIVIRNLAVSDMLMGFYLSFIAIQDHRFREQYHFKSMEWVNSWSCIVIGMLAITSSEVSLLILTFISIERFLLIAGPFNSRRRLNTNNIQLCLFAIWLSGGTIALFPGIRYNYYYYKVAKLETRSSSFVKSWCSFSLVWVETV